METKVYDLGIVDDKELKFAVIVSKFNGKFVYARHKERETWEIPGGHRELDEDIDDTAVRELKEETGAVKFNIKPICDYLCEYSLEKGNIDKSYGRLYYAEIQELGELPNLEIGEIALFEDMPDNLTYPEIQPILLNEVVKKKINIKEIIFDLDGTLWDSTDVVLQAWNDTLSGIKEVQKPLTKEALQSIMGLQLKEIGHVLFPYLDDEFRIELMKKCCAMERQWIRKQGGNLFENLEDILKLLSQKYKLFIVSNCDCGYIESFLEYHHELKSYFVDFECVGNTGLSKGENINKIIQKHKLENPIYVGDTQGDCDAAKVANIPFVFASYGFGKVSSYDYKIEQISDVLNL